MLVGVSAVSSAVVPLSDGGESGDASSPADSVAVVSESPDSLPAEVSVFEPEFESADDDTLSSPSFPDA